MNLRAILAVFCLLTGTAIAAPESDPSVTEKGHLVGPAGNARGAVTRQQFEARFETSAKEILANRTAARSDRFAAPWSGRFPVGSSAVSVSRGPPRAP